MVKNGCFASGDNELYFSCTVPETGSLETGIIFVHAAEGNRLGPHRMFIEAEEEFNRLGFATLRFDLSGCGDSTGRESKGDIEPDIRDTANAIRHFQKLAGVRQVILFGISKGALVAFNTASAEKLPVKGLILLSIPVSNMKAAMRNFGNGLKEYLHKLSDTKNLLRLIRGKVNLKIILQSLLHKLKLRNRYPKIAMKPAGSHFKILFIYGGCDPIVKESCEYYTEKCRQSGIEYQLHIIPNANHSFFHYEWKRRIFEIASDWLRNTSKAVK